MSKENNLKKNFDIIINDYKNYKQKTEIRLKEFLISAGEELGEYFISKGFIHFIQKNDPNLNKPDINYYYDPKTNVGIKIQIPNYIFLDDEYNQIPLAIVYKASKVFLDYNREVFFLYKTETPENTFKRFKKFNGRAESIRIKDYLREKFPKEMLKCDRADKMKNINQKTFD